MSEGARWIHLDHAARRDDAAGARLVRRAVHPRRQRDGDGVKLVAGAVAVKAEEVRAVPGAGGDPADLGHMGPTRFYAKSGSFSRIVAYSAPAGLTRAGES